MGIWWIGSGETMVSSYVKLMILGLIVLGYTALVEVMSYVVARRFSTLRIEQG